MVVAARRWGVSAPRAALPEGGWRSTRSHVGTEPGLLTQADQRDGPHHMTLCSAMKADRRQEDGGENGGSAGISLPKKCMMSPAFLGVTELLLRSRK